MEGKLASLFRRVRRIQALAALGEVYNAGILDGLFGGVSVTEYLSLLIRSSFKTYFEAMSMIDLLIVGIAGRFLWDDMGIQPGLMVLYDAARDYFSSIGSLSIIPFPVESITLTDINMPVFLLYSPIGLEDIYHIEIKLPELLSIETNIHSIILLTEIVQIVEYITAVFRLVDHLTIGETIYIFITIGEPLGIIPSLWVGVFPTEVISIADIVTPFYRLVVNEGIYDKLRYYLHISLYDTLFSTGRLWIMTHIDEAISVSDYGVPSFSMRGYLTSIGDVLSAAIAGSVVIYEPGFVAVGHLWAGIFVPENVSIADTIESSFRFGVSVGLGDLLIYALDIDLIDILKEVGHIWLGTFTDEVVSVAETINMLSNLFPTNLGIEEDLTFLVNTFITLYDTLLSNRILTLSMPIGEVISVSSAYLPVFLVNGSISIGEELTPVFTIPSLIDTIGEVGYLWVGAMGFFDGVSVADVSTPLSRLVGNMGVREVISSETVWVVAKVSITPLNSAAMIM